MPSRRDRVTHPRVDPPDHPGGHFETSHRIRRGRGKSRASLDLIAAARAFLERANPTSVRGVCYFLFTQGIISSMATNETSRVSRLLTDAREEGLIPWAWIVDETREMERASQWRNTADYIETVRRSYRRDFWREQPQRLEVWSEKGTVRGVLGPVLHEYGVGFRVMHGFSSATTVNDVAGSGGAPLVALYVGDFDCSGLFMSERDLPERLERYGGWNVRVQRVALLEDDLGELPGFSAHEKRRDPRYQWFIENYGTECWEVDAMDPVALRERVEDAIRAHIEPEAWARCEAAQQAEQATLEAFLKAWPGAA